MSTDWDIRCLDCGEDHGFDSMNRREDLMLALVRNAKALAQFAETAADLREHGIELRVMYPERGVDVAFFARHRDHKLRPINEYGQLSGSCEHFASCLSCGTTHPCALASGHDNDHQAPKRS